MSGSGEGQRIMVTGVSGDLAGRVAQRLEADDTVEEVVGVDLREPRTDLRRTTFVRADLRSPMIAQVLDRTGVDTVVHLAISARPHSTGGRPRMKELNVIGTMQLMAAAQRARRVRRLVLKSTTAVYGSRHHDPALFGEETGLGAGPDSGYAKDTVEVEGYARSAARSRDDLDLTVLRFANFMGAHVDSPLTDYLALPVVPLAAGFDPRLQFVHPDDAVAVLHAAVTGHRPGTFNVAGDGVLYLSQAVRLAGRIGARLPTPALRLLAAGARRARRVDFSAEQLPLLQYGRVADTSRLRHDFGYEPRWTTRAAFDDFVGARLRPLVEPATLSRWERELGDLLTGRSLPEGVGRPQRQRQEA